jgi:small subunit ribosomal protein S1
VRALCPASQVEIGYAQDLSVYEGQTLQFRVIEIKDDGRSVVLSRRALLEAQRKERQAALEDTLVPGADLEGVVSSLSRHGAIVDLGGIDGFVHVSELAHRRVDKPEDVVSVGDRVAVRVLGVEQGDRGLRVKLSMKARADAPEPPAVDEVLDATVVKATGGGIIVRTAKGEGLVPLAELGLAPGADHRRAFPVGKQLEVVLTARDTSRGRLRFSAVGVARVEERQNYREFGAASAAGGSFGSLGDVLRKKLGLPE